MSFCSQSRNYMIKRNKQYRKLLLILSIWCTDYSVAMLINRVRSSYKKSQLVKMLKYSDWWDWKCFVSLKDSLSFHCKWFCLTYLSFCTLGSICVHTNWFFWILCTSCLQLSAFRSLRCYKREEACPCDEVEGLIINNYRPPLPLGNRELRECGSA